MMKLPWISRSSATKQANEAAAATLQELARAALTIVPGGQASSAHSLYALDNPIFYSTPQSPKRKPMAIADTTTLRQIADTCDPVRIAVEHLKREVKSRPRRIVSKNRKDSSEATRRRIQEAENWFKKDGGMGGFGTRLGNFETAILEDLLVIGAYAIAHDVTIGGRLIESYAVDASTIRPRVDAYGFPDSGHRYEQWIQGMVVAKFHADEMTYDGINARSWTPNFISPIEWLIAPITAAMKADEWNRAWLTDGNAPGDDIFTLPENLPQEKISTFIRLFNDILTGNTKERQRSRFLPGGSQRLSNGTRKDQDFQAFELWLLRRIHAIYGVHITATGFAGEQYKVSQESSQDSTSQFGAGALLMELKDIYDEVLQRIGFDDLEILCAEESQEDPGERAERNQKAVGKPWKTVNEARSEDGLDPIKGGDELTAPQADTKPADDLADDDEDDDPQRALSLWQKKALNRLRRGKPAACSFDSDAITGALADQIREGLSSATTAAQVRAIFETNQC